MRSSKIFSLIILSLIISGLSYGQQFSNLNLYHSNRILLNPANTGDQNQTVAFLNARNQWASIDGAPTLMAFGVHGTLKEHMGLGGYIMSEKTDILSLTSLNINYAYGIQVKEDHNFTFGLGANVFQNRIDFDAIVVDDLNDKVIADYSDNGLTVDFSAGLNYTYKKLQAGISVLQLAESGVNHIGTETDLTYDILRNTNFYVSYDFEVSDNLDIEPMFLYRSATDVPPQFDLNAFTTWKDFVWVGLGYRNSGKTWVESSDGGNYKEFNLSLANSYFLLSGGFILNDNLRFGYGYEISNSDLYKQSNGTHEIALTYYFKGAKANKDDKNYKKIIDLMKQNQKDLVDRMDSLNGKLDENLMKTNELAAGNEKQDQSIETLKNEIAGIEIPEVQAPATTTGKEIEPLNIIYFSTGGDFLSQEAKMELRKILIYLIKNQDAKVQIIGHADDVGDEESNKALSNRRAMQVYDYFVNNTISKDRMEVVAKGESEPMVPNKTNEGRTINRRVEVIIH